MKRRPRGSFLGWFALLAGVIIILALILPTGFWWFLLAIVLLGVGIWLIRCS